MAARSPRQRRPLTGGPTTRSEIDGDAGPGRVRRPEHTRGRRRLPAGPILALGVIVVGWLFGASLAGGCWADQWGTWQYEAHFIVALAGAVSLTTAAVSYLIARHRLTLITGSAAAVATWIAFAATGAL